MLGNLLPIASGFFFVTLAVVVLSNKRVDRFHVYFSLFLFAGAAWSIALGLFLISNSQSFGSAMVATFYDGGIIVAYTILMFARTVPGKGIHRAWHKRLGAVLLIPVVGLIVWTVLPNRFYTDVSVDGLHNTYRLVLLPYCVYAFFFVAYIGYALVVLYRKYSTRSKLSNPYRQGLRLVSIALGFGTGVNALTNLILPLVGEYSYIWIGPLVVIPMTIVIWYAILKHGFFDIRLIIVRTLGYILSIVTLALVYIALANLVSILFVKDGVSSGVSLGPINIIFVLVLAFIFQPIKNFFDHVTDRIFYRDTYNSEEFIALLSNVLSVTSELRDLMVRASDVIGMTLKSRQVFFAVYYPDHGYVTAGTHGHSVFSTDEIKVLMSHVTYIHGKIVMAEELTLHSEPYRILARHKVALLLPLWHDGEIMGYLALGDPLSGQHSRRDIRVLETIADELVIAIENALNLEQVRDVNETLQTRIDHATHSLRLSNDKLRKLDDAKDEFISMASHQLRTPLTSVKGYISMILDGDAGPVSEQQQRFLSEAFDSSNRMAGIIGDFLNVSRLQTGKFSLEREDVDLSEIVESEVQHLKNTAAVRGLTLNYHRPARFPEMSLDRSKVEQVVMNFIDNAIFYAPESGSIEIELFQRAGRAVFTVRDHGIGVPKSEQANLFTKFFRATNARRKRPDGTGVGLFLAKKVIVAHKGAVIFDSVEGQGSTFGFEIPLR